MNRCVYIGFLIRMTDRWILHASCSKMGGSLISHFHFVCYCILLAEHVRRWDMQHCYPSYWYEAHLKDAGFLNFFTKSQRSDRLQGGNKERRKGCIWKQHIAFSSGVLRLHNRQACYPCCLIMKPTILIAACVWSCLHWAFGTCFLTETSGPTEQLAHQRLHSSPQCISIWISLIYIYRKHVGTG